jgi:hypothetical protein
LRGSEFDTVLVIIVVVMAVALLVIRRLAR